MKNHVRYPVEYLGDKPNLWELAISLTGLSVWIVWIIYMLPMID